VIVARAPLFYKFASCLLAAAIAGSSLVGCSVPETAFGDTHAQKKALFNAVIRGVQCEIRRAVKDQVRDPRVAWLKNWSALIHLNLKFDTTLAFNPGVTFKTPMVPAVVSLGNQTRQVFGQMYKFGVGGNFSGQAIRTEDVTFFYPFDATFFNTPDDPSTSCYRYGGLTIGADLKLGDWLDDVLEPVKKCAFAGRPVAGPAATVLGYELASEDDGARCTREELRLGYSKDNPIKALSHEITFMVTFEGGVTPSWNLVRIESPIVSPLFGARRRDTSDLIITFGSADTREVIVKKERGTLGPERVPAPSQEMRDRDLSLQIGSAVRDALRQ
jgi:hypothetical protein